MVTPARPLRHGALHKSRNAYDLLVDRPDGRRVGTLLLLAARSPRSLIYLPLREAAPEPWFGTHDETPLDLVLVHRAVQFRPSHWKRLRARMNSAGARSEPRTVRLPLSDLPTESDGASGRPAPYVPLEAVRLHRSEHASTLVLTGGTAAFREAARKVFAVAGEGPSVAARQRFEDGGCPYHVCRGLQGAMGPCATDDDPIHVEFVNMWAR